MVCGVHIAEILLFLVFLFSLLDELCYFCLHLFSKFWVRFVRGHGKLNSVLAFQQFKLLLLCPLWIESSKLLISIESWCSELLTPPWCMLSSHVWVWIKCDIIFDDTLVEVGDSEVPDFLLIATSINNWKIGIRRVRINCLSLDIRPVPLLIIIFSRNKRSYSNSFLLIRISMS